MKGEIIHLLTIAFFLLLEGLFSGGEIALVASDINRMRRRAAAGSRSAGKALSLLARPEWFLSTALIGTNLCVIANTALATAALIPIFGPGKGEAIAIVVMIPLILIVGEIIPKSIFQRHAEAAAPKIAWFIWGASWVFFPFVFVLSKISRGAVHLFSERGTLYPRYITRAGLEHLLRSGETADIMKSEMVMIKRIFEFSDVTAADIMAPLSAVTVLPAGTTLRDASRTAAEKGFTRIPVYRDKIFNIVGIIDAFDLLSTFIPPEAAPDTPEMERPVDDFMKTDILYVPETKPARALLHELRSRGAHMAIIVDEYGGATGIATVEDILEEIVGEIDDDYLGGAKAAYRKVGPGKYLVDARTKIEYLHEVFPFDIPDGDYETLGGFLLQRMGRIPGRHETYRLGQTLFVIEDADMKSIKEVLVVVPQGSSVPREK